MALSANAEARQGAVDSVLSGMGTVPAGIGDELFAVADAFDASPQLRRALTEPALPVEDRRQVARRLFDGKVSGPVLAVIEAAIGQSWRSGLALVSAIERQGVRAVLLTAEQTGILDDVEDTLFRFGRIVDSDHELRTTLGDRNAPLESRQTLVTRLLSGKVPEQTLVLARRAVVARDRTFDLTLETYLQISAAVRRRSIATVYVAHPLSADHEAKLRAALSAQAQRPVTLMVVVDPGLVGGVRVEMGDEVIDGSMAGRLEAARRQLA
ncbi:MAG TPA: F0F1 ATP synthase subunit delta [Propionibacteriaceae bacterium]|nr:F0F1 ATP synthase subunit delta [Propionibacteriaceae bacterium]